MLGYFKLNADGSIQSANKQHEGFESLDLLAKDTDGKVFKYYNLTIDATSGKYEPDTVKNEAETLELAVQGFTKKTTEFIQARVDEYNLANGTKFDNVHNCESYSRTVGYTHQIFCAQVWTWNVAVWEAVRAITTIPTDIEFQDTLDGVIF